MDTYNESPTVELFEKYAKSAKRILLAVAYLDEKMVERLTSICRKNKTELRVVSDASFNADPYKRGRIRSQIESVGQFRTSSGVGGEGIMHTKIYVFYTSDTRAVVFNTSANLTENAWNSRNIESPVTREVGDIDDVQLSVLINRAEEIWNNSVSNQQELLKIGSRVRHHRRPELGQGEIIKIQESNARVTFGDRVIPASLADLELVVDPIGLIREGESDGTPNSFARLRARFLATYIHAQNDLTGEFENVAIKPVPHQLLALKKAITSSHGGNMLFADDVGLGKTIEAGLVIKNTLRRIGDKARILILVPAGLKWQWKDEMDTKFGIHFELWGSDTTGPSAEVLGEGPGSRPLLIASQQKAVVGATEEAILRHAAAFDLVVADECHRFSNSDTQMWQLLSQMVERGLIKNLLLLSATPHSGDLDKFNNLLFLLDRNQFPRSRKTVLKIHDNDPILHDYVVRHDKLGVTDFEGKPLFKDIKTESIFVELTPEEKKFCDLVIKYVRELYNAKEKASGGVATQIGFLMSVYRKMLASSWKNVFRSMRARYRFLSREAIEENLREGEELPGFGDDEEGQYADELVNEREERKIEKLIKEMNLKTVVRDELSFLKNIVEEGKKLEKARIDTKVDKLTELLNDSEHRNSKFIIFTQYVKTLEVIKAALGGADRVAEIQGSIPPEDRKQQIDKFQKRVRFMVSTEAGGEGVNLQFAYKVVNFDMPWNPARIQQRIGRVWRYGQDKDVSVYNFYVDGTEDDIVLKRLDEKMTQIVNAFLIPLEYQGIAKELRGALVFDLKMQILGTVQESDDPTKGIESIIGEMRKEVRESRLRNAEKRMKESLEFIQKDRQDLARVTGETITELSNFYAPRGISFLRFFADAFAESLGGCVQDMAESTFRFQIPELSLKEIPFEHGFVNTRKYTTEKGAQRESVRYFGYGDTIFNHIVEFCRQPEFGGIAGYRRMGSNSSDVIALASTIVQATDASDEKYLVCAFYSVTRHCSLSPEEMFEVAWECGTPSAINCLTDDLERGIMRIFEDRARMLQAMRKKVFVANEEFSVEAAIGVSPTPIAHAL